MSKFCNETQFVFSPEFIGFTNIPNYIFRCKDISLKAVGLYCSILEFQNSPTHKISVKGLMAIKTDKQTSIQNGLNELIKHGFITRETIRNEKGELAGVKYTVYMKPVVTQRVEPKVDFQNVDNPNVENPSNNKENKKKGKYEKSISTTGDKSLVVSAAAPQSDKKPLSDKMSPAPIETPAPNQSVKKIEENITIIEMIQEKTNLKLSAFQRKLVSKWKEEKVIDAIAIYNELGGLYFKLFRKIYEDGAKRGLTDRVSAKVKLQNEMDNHQTPVWDNEEILRIRRDFEYGLLTKEEYKEKLLKAKPDIDYLFNEEEKRE